MRNKLQGGSPFAIVKTVGFEQRLEFSLRGQRLRELGATYWAEFVGRAGAKVLSSVATDRLTAYLLSESSLLVWDERALLITCGQMNPLSALVGGDFIIHGPSSVERVEIDAWSSEAKAFLGHFRPPLQVRQYLGLDGFFPGFEVDHHSFTPYGYSLNAVYREFYYTVHISPEVSGGYLSFETNANLGDLRPRLVRHLQSLFRPENPSFASP